MRKKKTKKNILMLFLIVLLLVVSSYFIVSKVFLAKNQESEETMQEQQKEEPQQEVETPSSSETQEEENNSGLKIVDGILIVNKSFPLPEDYVPEDPYEPLNGRDYCSYCVTKETYEHFKEMQTDIEVLGLNIWIQSGYRSYNFQNGLYNNYVNRDGKDAADTYSARPGHSEHQTGLAFDLNTISSDFAYTPEGKWIHNNAYLYGFILRYPEGKENITGYMYEPWHLRYVGKELAAKLYNNGDWITLEEYFDLPSTYEN